MKIIKTSFLLIFLFSSNILYADDKTFSDWLLSFKKLALKEGISEITFDQSMKNVKFLPKVIDSSNAWLGGNIRFHERQQTSKHCGFQVWEILTTIKQTIGFSWKVYF